MLPNSGQYPFVAVCMVLLCSVLETGSIFRKLKLMDISSEMG